jgi:hypothetical protein
VFLFATATPGSIDTSSAYIKLTKIPPCTTVGLGLDDHGECLRRRASTQDLIFSDAKTNRPTSEFAKATLRSKGLEHDT